MNHRDEYLEAADEQASSNDRQSFCQIGEQVRQSGIKEILHGWGRWACCRFGTEYPKKAAGILGAPAEPRDVFEECTDEQGQIIDRAVCYLKTHNPDSYAVIFCYYVKSMSQKSIAKGMNCSEITIRRDMQIGEAFLSGILLKETIFKF
jgi:hypothetical protein